jgi:NodT family efflux transporter outer membrane factor (OMF) lipoprotein
MKGQIKHLKVIVVCASFLGFIGCQPKLENNISQEETQDEVYMVREWLTGNWWEIFEDEKLNTLVEQSLSEHPSIKVAEDRIQLASWSAREVKASLFPTLDFNADTIKTLQSKTGIFGPPPPPALDLFPRNYTQTEFNLTILYEFDFWEKNKNQWRAALGEVQAVKAEELVSRLVLSLSVSNVYFRIQTDLIRKKIATEFENNSQEMLRLTNLSMQKGLATSITQKFRENSLLNANEQTLGTELDLVTDQHTLTALLASNTQIGITGFETSIEALYHLIDNLAKTCFNELPLDLIAYRPDIQAMLFRISSFGFQIKVATSLFYPNVNLLALTGFQTIHLPKLFNGESLYGMWGPALYLPIFDGGALKANLGLRKTEYKIAVDEYNETILNAVKQVLDAKSNLDVIQLQLANARTITFKALEIVDLIERKVKAHLASNFDLLVAKADYLNAKNHEAVLQFANLEAVLNLVRALGGGYK